MPYPFDAEVVTPLHGPLAVWERSLQRFLTVSNLCAAPENVVARRFYTAGLSADVRNGPAHGVTADSNRLCYCLSASESEAGSPKLKVDHGYPRAKKLQFLRFQVRD